MDIMVFTSHESRTEPHMYRHSGHGYYNKLWLEEILTARSPQDKVGSTLH